jgi:hypothetical protein
MPAPSRVLLPPRLRLVRIAGPRILPAEQSISIFGDRPSPYISLAYMPPLSIPQRGHGNYSRSQRSIEGARSDPKIDAFQVSSNVARASCSDPFIERFALRVIGCRNRNTDAIVVLMSTGNLASACGHQLTWRRCKTLWVQPVQFIHFLALRFKPDLWQFRCTHWRRKPNVPRVRVGGVGSTRGVKGATESSKAQRILPQRSYEREVSV